MRVLTSAGRHGDPVGGLLLARVMRGDWSAAVRLREVMLRMGIAE